VAKPRRDSSSRVTGVTGDKELLIGGVSCSQLGADPLGTWSRGVGTRERPLYQQKIRKMIKQITKKIPTSSPGDIHQGRGSLKPQRQIALRLEEERGGSLRRRRRFPTSLREPSVIGRLNPFQELLYIYSLPEQAQRVFQERRLAELASIVGLVNIKFMTKVSSSSLNRLSNPDLGVELPWTIPPLDHGRLHVMILFP